MLIADFLHNNSIPEPNSGCWIWIGYVSPAGYGQANGFFGNFLAHRLSYIIFKGDIPRGHMIRHLCHNKCCINPDHLLHGTAKDNAADNKRKWV